MIDREKRDTALNELGVAAHQILRAQDDLAQARIKKDAALVALYQSGVRKGELSVCIRDYLWDHGFGLDLIKRLAVSPAAIRKVCDRVKPR